VSIYPPRGDGLNLKALGCLILTMYLPNTLLRAETGTEILTASATSSSLGSSDVACLLDPACKGYWSPDARDNGTNEGVFVQLKKAVPVDYIDIHMTANLDTDKTSLECYLDGKQTTEQRAFFRVFLVGIEKGELLYRVSSGEAQNAPLKMSVRSIFVKYKNIGFKSAKPGEKPTITKIRLVKDDVVIPVQPLRTVKTSVKVSSILNPVVAYQAANLFDSNYDFAWSSDGKKGDGVGESLQFSFETPVDLKGLMLWNGYQRSPVHYSANNRVSKLTLRGDKGAPSTLVVKDVSGAQSMFLGSPIMGTKTLTIEIQGIYPGAKYRDTLISEMRFIDVDGHVMNPLVKKRNPTVSDIWKGLLDVTWACVGGQLANEKGLSRSFIRQTFRFRRNGTFVIYDEKTGYQEDFGLDELFDDDIYEGNWEETARGWRVFGKKYSPTYTASQYMNEERGNGYGIFQSPFEIKRYSEVDLGQRMSIIRRMVTSHQSGEREMDRLIYWQTILVSKDDPRRELSGKNLEALLKKIDGYFSSKKNAYVFKSDFVQAVVVPSDTIVMRRDYEN